VIGPFRGLCTTVCGGVVADWLTPKAVVKRRGLGILPGYYERGPWLLSRENRSKIEPKETPSCLIPRLLVVFTQQLEISVTTLNTSNYGSVGRYGVLLVLSHCIQ